jgi:TPR repeat protein
MKKHLLEAAERGDAEAQFNLGIIHENGIER